MLTPNDSVALSLAVAFFNAILHYILYKIAVGFIHLIKDLIFYIAKKLKSFDHVCTTKRHCTTECDDSLNEFSMT
jgi:hypothetical protein